MSLRAFSLSALSLSLLLGACDGSGSSEIMSDIPAAGSPEAPSVVTKGKVPGGTESPTDTPSAQNAIVGTWKATSPATEDQDEESYTLVFTADGKGTLTYVRGKNRMVSDLAWTATGSGYALQLSIEEDAFPATGKISGSTLTITAQGNDLVLTRVK